MSDPAHCGGLHTAHGRSRTLRYSKVHSVPEIQNMSVDVTAI